MDSKAIALILIALLVGLGGGYGLGYVIYQPQIQNLQQELNNFSDRLDTFNSTLRDTQSSVTSIENGLGSLNSDVESLENGLNSLDSEVTSLDSTVGEIESRTWHEASSLQGSSDAIGANFQMRGKVMRIRWLVEGLSASAWIQIIIRYSDGTWFADRGSSGTYGSYSSDIATTGLAGQFYIEVNTYDLDNYLVVVWDYY